MGRLADRTAIVTGSSSGIGNAIAAAFGREGANVVLADVRETPKLPAETPVTEKLDRNSAEYTFVETDVSDQAAVEALVDTAATEYGGVDILVNNAGILNHGMTHEMSPDEWHRILEVNLTGTFLMCRTCLPHLIDSDHGKIINLSSVLGVVGNERQPAYCAAKGGITNYTRQLALDYAPHEINVNAIAPGTITTAQNAEWREQNPDEAAAWLERIPWPRFGTPEDVAPVAVFLASDASAYVTGDVLLVDGGWTAQ